MNESVKSSLKLLIDHGRSQSDSVAWAKSLLQEIDATPEGVQLFVQTWSAAGSAVAAELLRTSELPRCSFCLKTSADVRGMVASSNANICNECSHIVRKTLARQRGGLLSRLRWKR